MIKELTQFVDSLDTDFKALGVRPKGGLHILLKIQSDGERQYMDESSVIQVGYTRRKAQDSEEQAFLEQCASLTQLGWCVNTNKCFDLPAKGIHTCSPYCVAFKKESLEGGGKYEKDKIKIYERFNAYFNNALELVEQPEERERINIFQYFINSKEKLDAILARYPLEYKDLKDTEYIILYLDEPIASYQQANEKYLVDKLFNTNEYNSQVADEVFGTSDFFNGFPTKKPFLSHQSATFDIAGRISAKEARALYEFKDLIGRGILPKPLPIFIYQDELKEATIALFKKNAELGAKTGYQAIIESLYESHQEDFGNYYLLFYLAGEIKDFDFVSKFEYELSDANGDCWKINDWFSVNYSRVLKNVFDLHLSVLLPVFNNALVVRTKSGEIQARYFDDIDAKYCKSDNTYLLVTTYRKAFYDFIYKSKRQAITQAAFDTILQKSLLDDIRLDEFKNNQHSQNLNIRQKLNIWFSLSEKFNLQSQSTETMASNLQAHRSLIQQLVKGETTLQTDEQYAFTVGQVIFYLLTKSRTSDRSYKRLEPFLQQVHSKELNKAIARLFDTYKHENFSNNFRVPFAEVMAYETKFNLRDLIPTMLAGIFSRNELFSEREQKEVAEKSPGNQEDSE